MALFYSPICVRLVRFSLSDLTNYAHLFKYLDLILEFENLSCRMIFLVARSFDLDSEMD